MRRRFHLRLPVPLAALFLFMAVVTGLRADAPAFDLMGPKVDVHVQRDGKTLPIAEVPNLLPGDRLWIHPDLPESQSAHYVLIVAFLRGSTNPPPTEWFKRVETWLPAVREEGVFVVVPAEAQQALIFLAPETSGDFNTLRKAVQGRPGAFVRATQDLQQASWDRLRLDAYLADVKTLSLGDPKTLKERTELTASSLGIRVDQQCFDKPTEQQAPCLVQHTDGLVMDDSNAQSVVNQMANGAAGDMMNQLSYANLAGAGAGAFSPYVGAVLDLARILSSLHTAKYQYIPALALPQREQEDTLNLRLNVPPSFRDPKSVIVVALPPVGPSHVPQLRAAELAQNAPPSYCATKPNLAFSAEGSPLLFGTALAHDLTLHIETKAKLPPTEPGHPELVAPELVAKPDQHTGTPKPAMQKQNQSPNWVGAGQSPASGSGVSPSGTEAAGIDLPIKSDPTRGGFILEKPLPQLPEAEVVAEIRGKWGFDSWEGPKYHLGTPRPGTWTIPAADQNALITGREDQLHIQGESTLCVADVEAAFAENHSPETKAEVKPSKLTWKSPKPELIEIAVPLKDAAPGVVTIAIHQYGMAKPDELSLKAYTEAAAIDHLTLSAGDTSAVLKGKRLDEVESADLAGISFAPAALNRVQDFDQLEMSATGITSTLRPGSNYSAKVTLRDGRTLRVPATVGSPRPQVDLLSKGEQHEESGGDSTTPVAFHLGSANDLPLQRRLVFFLRSRVPAVFARTEKVEISAVDSAGGSFQTTLSFADGSLMLEDAHTAVGVIDPLARFGPSAFGPIQLRAVTADGVSGDWVPLGTLVRLPGFNATAGSKDLRCPRNPAKSCLLSGTNLFLITAVSASPDMANAVDVPPEFTGVALSVPNTAHAVAGGSTGTLYVRLRDDPDTIQTLSLPASAPIPGASPGTTDSAANAAPVTSPAPKADPPPDPAPEQTAPSAGPSAAPQASAPPLPN